MKGLKVLPINLRLHTTGTTSHGKNIAVLLVMSFISAGCATQTRTISFEAGNLLSSPRFEFFIANYPSVNPDSSGGSLYARVRYDDLIFIRTDSAFTAHYQLSVNLYLDRGLTESRYSKTFDRRITVSKYSRTLSSLVYDTLKDNLLMKPGKYFGVFRFLDLNTNITSSKEFEYTVKDFFRDAVNISDIVLYDRSDTSGVQVEAVKNRSGYLYADFYVTSRSIPANISLHLIAKSVEAPTSIDTMYELDQASKVQRCRLPVNIGGLAPAFYDLRISAKENGKENFAETAFRVMADFSAAAGFDHETGPLMYIMTKGELDSLKREAATEREKKLKDFWLARSHRDTTLAELMEKEFYKRVDTADAEFGAPLTPGWQTDRGRIYVLYGKPDQIESHFNDFREGPGANSSPYQIWYYNSLKLRFVFVYELRDGDYRLAKTGGT
ncbi:MAG: GWxTD domain-containing protein [Candidatus Kryptoniota bacterium]